MIIPVYVMIMFSVLSPQASRVFRGSRDFGETKFEGLVSGCNHLAFINSSQAILLHSTQKPVYCNTSHGPCAYAQCLVCAASFYWLVG